MARPIIDKFIILQANNGIKGVYIKEFDPSNGDVHCRYNKITPEQAKTATVIAKYDGLDAVIAYWDYQFNQIPRDMQQLINVIFPNIDNADKLTLKTPLELLALATVKAKAFINKTCVLCSGRGWRYGGGSQICFNCHGSGKVLPPITAHLLDELSKHLRGGAYYKPIQSNKVACLFNNTKS